jgi:hypothetical protein
LFSHHAVASHPLESVPGNLEFYRRIRFVITF